MVVLAALPCRDAFLTARDNRPALFTSFIQDTLCAGIVLKDGDPPTKMTKTQIDGIIFGAIKFTEKLDKKGDLGELTQDMAAAIYVYTCESPFYKQLNKLLRDEDRTALQPFFPYLRLLLTALRRLPKIERNVYRGVGLDLQDQYPEGETVVWWAVSSTTKTMKVLKDFLGESGKRTIFIVEVKSARDIMKYSWKTTEDELILLPGTVFKVTSVLPQGDLTMINMEEDLTAPDMIDSGEDDYQMCDPESFYAVLEPDDAVQYASPVDVGGSGGGGGKASIPKVFQCERPNPRGGNCKNRRAGDGKFCKGHSCTHSGCSASKSSKDAFCDQHSDGDARTDEPVAASPAFTVEEQRIYIAPLNEEQFEMLDPRATTFPEELPTYCMNIDHNRYWDIIPNGITRVKLTVENDDQSTDYINANYVRGYGQAGAKKYIAAQGPLATSLERFIRMIWECNVLTIVMITGLVEAGEVTCERYWPEDEDEPMHIGRFVVRLLGIEYEDGYRFHDLEITTANGEKKVLRHYWFDSWPDHGVPENSLGEVFPDNAVHMLMSARTEQRRLADLGERDAPLLVHCSAGIGRTGTFITIDHAMDAIKSKSKVDLNDIVEHLREDRMGMIQHTSQYKFAYV